MSVIFYITVIGISSILGCLYQYFKNKNLKLLGYTAYSSSFFIVWIVSAFRYSIGTDYFLYRNIFKYAIEGHSINEIIKMYDIEPGWATLNYMISIIFKDPQYIFIISSFIFIFCIYKLISENEKNINVGLSIFIFLIVAYIPSFNTVRQYFAIGILMISFKYIKQKKLKTFILLVLIATSFHYTSIIFIIAYWIINKDIGIIKIILLSTIVFILFINYNNILRIITILSPGFGKYSRYEATGIFQFNKTLIFFQLALIFLIILSSKFLKNRNKFIYKTTYLYYIGIVFSFLGNFVPFAGRTSYCFDISQILFISCICKYGEKGLNKLILNILIILYYIVFWYISFVYSGNNGAIPYISVY